MSRISNYPNLMGMSDNGSVADRRDEELNTLDILFRAMKMDDMTVSFDDKGNLVCTDDMNNKWVNAELYDFIINEALCFGADGKLFDGFEMNDELIEKIKAYAAEYSVYPNVTMPDESIEFCELDMVSNAFRVFPSFKKFVMNMIEIAEDYISKSFINQKDGKYFIPFSELENSICMVNDFRYKVFTDMLLDQIEIENIETDDNGYHICFSPEYKEMISVVDDNNIFTEETEDELDAEL